MRCHSYSDNNSYCHTSLNSYELSRLSKRMGRFLALVRISHIGDSTFNSFFPGVLIYPNKICVFFTTGRLFHNIDIYALLEFNLKHVSIKKHEKRKAYAQSEWHIYVAICQRLHCVELRCANPGNCKFHFSLTDFCLLTRNRFNFSVEKTNFRIVRTVCLSQLYIRFSWNFVITSGGWRKAT